MWASLRMALSGGTNGATVRPTPAGPRMAPWLFRRSMPIRVFSRSDHVAGLVILRQTFVRRRHRPTMSTSCCSSMVSPSASGTAAGRRRSWHAEDRLPHRIEAELISALGMGTNLDVAAADQSRPSATRAAKLIDPMRSIFIPHLGKIGLEYFLPSECEVAHTSRGLTSGPAVIKLRPGPLRPSRGRWRVISARPCWDALKPLPDLVDLRHPAAGNMPSSRTSRSVSVEQRRPLAAPFSGARREVAAQQPWGRAPGRLRVSCCRGGGPPSARGEDVHAGATARDDRRLFTRAGHAVAADALGNPIRGATLALVWTRPRDARAAVLIALAGPAAESCTHGIPRPNASGCGRPLGRRPSQRDACPRRR